MSGQGERWSAPPNWPAPAPGWSPPTGWQPPAEWGPAPPEWQFWQPADGAAARRKTNARTLKIVGGGLFALLLFSSCAALFDSDSPDEEVAAGATSEPSVSAPIVSPSPIAPSSSPSPEPSLPPPPAPPPQGGALDVAKLKAFLATTYADTAWADNITEIRNVGGAAFVETSLPSSSADGPAICSAVSAFLFSDEYGGDPRVDFPGIRVAAITGERLSFRPTLSAQC